MAEAGLIFAGTYLPVPDHRKDSDEMRHITDGTRGRRVVGVVWTVRADVPDLATS